EAIEQARPLMCAVIEATLGEPGCRAYSYAEDVADPGLFRVVELWDSREALSAHFDAPHMKVWPSNAQRSGFSTGRSRRMRWARRKNHSSGDLSGSFIAGDLELDPVPVEEVEPAAGRVVGVTEGLEAVLDHNALGGVQIVVQQADVVERAALALARVIGAVGIECEVGHVLADMDRFAAIDRRTAPALVPAEQLLEQRCRALDIDDGEVDVLDTSLGHLPNSCDKALFYRAFFHRLV